MECDVRSCYFKMLRAHLSRCACRIVLCEECLREEYSASNSVLSAARVYEVKGADITVSGRRADIEIARMFSAFSVPDVD